MNTRNIFKIAIAAIGLLAAGRDATAQLVNCNGFIKGNYIEVGVNSLGSYGSSTEAPTGYHPRGGNSVFNTCSMTIGPAGTSLGFVADPDKDGWSTGTPAYIGDYFLPGSPYEGWMIEVNGTKTFQHNGATSSLGSITSVNNSGRVRSVVWQGAYSGLAIRQVTSLDTANLFFTTSVTLRNTTSSPRANVYYLRGVDADNEQTVSGNFSTNNSIVYQRPNALNATLVSATGTTYGAYLGLGTLDTRARCYILPAWPPSPALSTIYGGATGYTYSGNLNGDYAIGIVFNLGTIAAGDSTTFVYTYILRGSDFLTALATTTSNWQATGDASFTHESGDTATICQYASSTITINNPADYSYTWSSLSGESLSATTGNSTTVTAGTTMVRLMAVGTGLGPNDTVYINVNPSKELPNTPTVASNSPLCVGGTMSLTASSTTSGVSYNWAGPGTYTSTAQHPSRTSATTTMSGVYSVTATKLGCTSAAGTTNVVVSTPPTSYSATGAGAYCAGGEGVTITLSGSETDVTYELGTSGTSAGSAITGTGSALSWGPITTAGIYTITATRTAGGCSTSTTVSGIVSVLGQPTSYTVTGGGAYCPDGSGVAVGLSGSESGVTYQLLRAGSTVGSAVTGTGSAISFGSVTEVGNYTVLATNSTTGCAAAMAGSVDVVLQTSPTISCAGNMTTAAEAGLCGANVSYTAATATGTPTPSISYSAASGSFFAVGTNVVTATASNACGTATCNFEIEVTAGSLSVSATATNTSCNGGNDGSISTTVSGGTGSYTYGWTGGASGANPTSLAAGTYTVTVSDATCSSISPATAVVTVGEPSALTVSATVTQPSCSYNTGSVSLSSTGGTGAITYSGSATSSLTTGTYSYTVTDANGCTASTTATISAPSAISYTSTTATNISCNNSNGGAHADGTATVNGASGGTGSLSYSWSNGATSNPATGLSAPATYSVTITDANGCSTTGSVTVGQPTLLTIGKTVTNVSCNSSNGGSSNNGSIVTTVSGGTSGYTYSWSGGATTANRTGLSAGTYSLTVTDAKGCTATTTATVNQPAAFGSSITVTPANTTYTGGNPNNIYLGYGPQTATLTANASTGSGYTYSWSPASRLSCTSCQNPVFTPTVAGTYNYTVTVTNSNGCTKRSSVTMNVVNVKDPSKKNKILLCHMTGSGHTNQLSIAASAVPAHLTGHSGDRLGECPGGCGSRPMAGTSEHEGNDAIMVYPNPTEGMINVELPLYMTTAKVTVIDAVGRVVTERTIAEHKGEVIQIDLAGATKGIYMVRIATEDEINTIKVLVR